jgi:hypothetical protein
MQGSTNLYSVTALSDDDAWAVGEYHPNAAPHSLTLIEHWDGHRWSQVDSTSTNPAGVNRFVTVEAISPDDVWAIGYACSPGSPVPDPDQFGLAGGVAPASVDRPDGCVALVERFNGHRWRPVTGGFADFVSDVAGPSSDDEWAVGYTGIEHTSRAEIRHFDGHRWRTVYQASETGTTLFSLAWISDDDIWVAGYGFDDRRSMLHWNGTRWKRMRMHGPGTVYGAYDVSGSTPDDVWTIAYNGEYVLDHWQGARWASHKFPHEGYGAHLQAVTSKYPDFTWAVGYTLSSDGGKGLLLHWTGDKWVNEARK